MTKPIFITLRILIAVLTFFVFRWLFLSSSTIVVAASGVHCQPVGWDYLGRNYGNGGFFDIHDPDEMEQFSTANDVKDDLADQRRARNDVINACSLARDNRRLYVNLTAIFAAGVFIVLPKPTRKRTNLNFLKLKRKDELVTAAEPQQNLAPSISYPQTRMAKATVKRQKGMAMTKPIFITLHILIAALTFLTPKWLFLSSPTTTVSASQIHCRAVGQDYLGKPYSASGFFDIHSIDDMGRFSSTNKTDDSLVEQRRGRNKIIEGCNFAHDSRKLYMNLTAIFAAIVFIIFPKPAQKKFNPNFLKLKRRDEPAIIAESQQNSALSISHS